MMQMITHRIAVPRLTVSFPEAVIVLSRLACRHAAKRLPAFCETPSKHEVRT